MSVKLHKSGFISTLLVLTLLLPGILAAPVIATTTYPLSANDTEVADALDYLRSELDTDGCLSDFATSAWAVMAITAAGEDPYDWYIDSNPSIVDYLETNAGSASATNDYSRMILAIAATGEDPTDFGGIDFVALLEAAHDETQIGDDELLNDDFWGVLALVAAGTDTGSAIIQDSVDFILDNQNADGGWSWGIGQDSDVDDTAAAIMALKAAGESPSSTAIINALDYIKTTQMDCGGFESWGSTNSATDSWGIDGLVAAGEDPTGTNWESGTGNTPMDDLLTFQNADGSFNWTADTPSNTALYTSYAITALVGQPYPVAVLAPAEGVTIDVRIEGHTDTIWSGTVTVDDSTITDDEGGEHYLEQPTALGALDEAAQEGSFTYVVQDTAYGLYVYSIDGEEPSGLSGWMYWVDYYSPSVGAADFILDETTPSDPPHQEILFAYAEWGDSMLQLAVDETEPDVDETFTVTVTEYDDDSDTWIPTESATVHADQNYTTDESGEVAITIETDLTVEVYADKDGYVRSNRVTVIVGEGSIQSAGSAGVGMTADIMPAISFSVDPDTIDFGVLGPRDTSDPHTLTLTNLGAWDLSITATVTDTAQNLYVDGLELDGAVWSLFSTLIERDEDTNCSVTLTVPETYTQTGSQNGTIIFWAEDGS